MEGRRHGHGGRGGGGFGMVEAGGCRARVRRHVTASGSGAQVGRAGSPLRELFHVRLAGGSDSAAGGDEEQRLRQRIMASVNRWRTTTLAHVQLSAGGFRVVFPLGVVTVIRTNNESLH